MTQRKSVFLSSIFLRMDVPEINTRKQRNKAFSNTGEGVTNIWRVSSLCPLLPSLLLSLPHPQQGDNDNLYHPHCHPQSQGHEGAISALMTQDGCHCLCNVSQSYHLGNSTSKSRDRLVRFEGVRGALKTLYKIVLPLSIYP